MLIKDEVKYGYFVSPIGLVEIAVKNSEITHIVFVEEMKKPNYTDIIIIKCQNQLLDYFAGLRKRFCLPLANLGTDFQKKVGKAMNEIPYGGTITYQNLATLIKKPTATRAVASAVSQNLFSIVIPCHRVVSTDNKSVKYGWGKERKLFLLNLEHKCAQRFNNSEFKK